MFRIPNLYDLYEIGEVQLVVEYLHKNLITARLL